MGEEQNLDEITQEKKRQENLMYGYEDEDKKSWLQKMVDYIKQKEAGSHKKLSDLA